MRLCIIQSCYIPWRGFFDLIRQCDLYVVLDSAQYVKRHWHNRNRIRTAAGVQWLTIPVLSKGAFTQPINAVEIAEPWAEQHWRSIENAYRRAPHFPDIAPRVRGWYEAAAREPRLTDINLIFLRGIAGIFGIATQIVTDDAFPAEGRKTERLMRIAQAAGANHYLSGPSARDYLDEAMLAEAGIATEWMDYAGYAPYPQLYGGFVPDVSVLDLLFNCGPDIALLGHPPA